MRAPNLPPPLFGIVTCGWVKKPLKCGRVHLMRVGEKNIQKKRSLGQTEATKCSGNHPAGKRVTTQTAGKRVTTQPRGENKSRPDYNSL